MKPTTTCQGDQEPNSTSNLPARLDLSCKSPMIFDQLDAASVFSNIMHLNLSSTSLKEFTGSDRCKTIESLNLSNNALKRIQGLEQFTSLKTLLLSNNEIQLVEGLETLENLETLDISCNNIVFLSNLERLEKLRNILASSNSISFVSSMKKLKELALLDLRANRVKSIRNWSLLLPDGIKSIYLSKNPLEDLLVGRDLTFFQGLNCIDLSETPLVLQASLARINYKQYMLVMLHGKMFEYNQELLGAEDYYAYARFSRRDESMICKTLDSFSAKRDKPEIASQIREFLKQKFPLDARLEYSLAEKTSKSPRILEIAPRNPLIDRFLSGLDHSDVFAEESNIASQSPLTYYLRHAHGSPSNKLLIPYTKGVSANISKATIPSTNNTNAENFNNKVAAMQGTNGSFNEIGDLRSLTRRKTKGNLGARSPIKVQSKSMSRLESKNNNSVVGPSFWIAPTPRQVLSGIIGRDKADQTSFVESFVPDIEMSRDLILKTSQVQVSSFVADRRHRVHEKHVIKIQAQARGIIVRRRFGEYKKNLRAIVKIQSLIRGALTRILYPGFKVTPCCPSKAFAASTAKTGEGLESITRTDSCERETEAESTDFRQMIQLLNDENRSLRVKLEENTNFIMRIMNRLEMN